MRDFFQTLWQTLSDTHLLCIICGIAILLIGWGVSLWIARKTAALFHCCRHTDKKCSCGRNTKRLGPILGRKAQMLKVHGTTLFPGAFFNILDGIPEVAEYYMEVSGSALSDEVTLFVACRSKSVEELDLVEKLYSRTRIHVPVKEIPLELATKRVFGTSRKPVRFFDLRKEM